MHIANPSVIFLYLMAVITANVIVACFGPIATPFVAFGLIGATLTLRDLLHDQYGPKSMLLLVPAGALLSLLFGGDVARIALAGAAAFALSEGTDAAIYHMLRHRPWFFRATRSNTVSAAVDSFAFMTLAFGGFPLVGIIGQFVAKTAGGAFWAWLLRPRSR